MTFTRFGFLALASAFVGTLMLIPALPAEACMECPCWSSHRGCHQCIGSPTPAEPIEVSFPEPGLAIIKVPEYQTTNLRPFHDCVTSMPISEGIEEVLSVVNLDSRTDLPFEEVSFAAAESLGDKIADFLAEEGYPVDRDVSWPAFPSTITGSVRDQVPNHFIITVQLEESADLLDFVRELRRSGAFVTASSDSQGIPDGGHTYYKAFRNFPMKVTLPNEPLGESLNLQTAP